MDVIVLVWVPYRAGIFQGRSYERHVRFFFDRFVGEVYAPEQLEWTTLEERRKHSRLLMLYKLKNNIVRVDASRKLIPNERPSRNNNEQALAILLLLPFNGHRQLVDYSATFWVCT
jgi:hypothetical protein